MDVEFWKQYGGLGIAVFVFAGVIWYLFKQYQKQIRKNEIAQDAIAKERTAWAVEREKLRGEYDTKYHEVLRDYAQKLVEEHKECTAREDAIREEHAVMVERMAQEQQKSADAMVEMLEKLQDRFVFRQR